MSMRSAVFVMCAASAVALGCRTASPGDLFKNVPKVDGGDTSSEDHATPGHEVGPPPGCVVDPKSVDAKTMVDVPAASFAMGCNAAVDDECRDDEKPQHTVNLGAFSIDQTEVTAAEYALCLQDGGCTKPYCAWDPCKNPKLPMVCIDYDQAVAYCNHVGKRLPTEAEWEQAARGGDGRKFPWGNEPADCDHANMDGCGGVKAVGSVPAGGSPFGALDMAGNVVEWVSDVYDAAYYQSSPQDNPQGPPRTAASWMGGRGGGWRSEAIWQRASSRDLYEQDYVKDSLGFRCVK